MPLMGGLEQIGVRAVVDGFKPYMSNLGKMETKTKGFGSSVGKFLKMGALVGGAALIGLGAAALKLGGEFDKAYDKIKVGTGASGEALKGLKKDFKAVFSAIPTDMGTASTAIADLNTRLGLTGKPLQQLSKQMIELSRITDTDLGANIESVTRLFGDWDVATEDQSASLDRLFKTSQATGIGVDKLSQLVVQFGAPLRNFGFTLDESTALLAKFDKEGVNTEAVMGGLKIGLGKIAAAGKDPAEAFREVSEQIKNAGSSGEANIAAIETFGSRAGPDMAAAIREGRFEIEDFVAQMDEGGEGILETAKATESWTEKLKILKNKALVKLEPVLIGLFDGLTKLFTVIEMKVIPALQEWWKRHGPKITKSLKDIGRGVRGFGKLVLPIFKTLLDKALRPLAEWFFNNETAIKTAMVAIGAIAVAAFTAWAISATAAAVATIAALWPVLAIAAVIGGLAAGIYLLVKHWDEVTAAVKGFIGTVKGIPVIGQIFEAARAVVQDKIKAIIGIVQGLIDFGKEFISFFKNVFSGEWGAAWDDLKDMAKIALGLFLDFLQLTFLGTLKSIFTALGIWDWAKGAFETFKTEASSFLDGVADTVRGVGESIAKALGEGLRSAIGWVKGALNALITQVEKGVNAVISLINAIPDVKLPFGVGTIGIPDIPRVSVPRLHRGAFEIPRDMLARLQAGEMVLPRPQAQVVRETMLAPSVAPQAAAIHRHIEVNVTDGSPAAIANAVKMADIELGLRTSAELEGLS